MDVVAEEGGRPVHGHIGERRSTHDGRVQITRNRHGVWFYTSRAERFRRPLVDERRSSEGRPLRADFSLFHASTAAEPRPDHVAICDPYLAGGVDKSPYACRHGGRPADCYDVWVLEVVHGAAQASGLVSELWATPVTVTVRNPKTASAEVAKVERRGSPVRSPIARTPKRSGDLLFEPVTSGDGRLLFVNAGDTLLYSVMAAGDTPCDGRNWKRLAHVSRMHRDPAMSRYGVARYPIRDSENRKVKAGKRLRGAYPWIDREGKNLFFTQVGAAGLFYRDPAGKMRSRFEVLNRPRNRLLELGGATRFGLSFFGLWSQGKIVVPDGRINNIDFLTGHHGYRPRAVLYRGDSGGVTLPRAPVVDINSVENQWNYRSAFAPRSPRDVVWWLSTNAGMTDEVVFDDALDAGLLVYSPMNAAVNNRKRTWRDGFDNDGRTGYGGTPRIQNAASSQLLWKPPSYGELAGARIEPIAAGGVVGKGLWLDGEGSRLEYAIPQQGGMGQATWTTTLWLDPRDASSERRLLTAPDGTWLDVTADRLTLGGAGGEAVVELPSELALRDKRWTHLGFVSTGDRVDVYVQGYKLGSVAGSYLRLQPGRLTVGSESSAPGFRGWLDELRVVSGAKDPEVMCNYAYGTLRGVDASGPGFAAAGSYPQASHDELSTRLQGVYARVYERYACERARDRSHTCLADVHRFEGGDPSCLRRVLLFPEGPLYHDQPRPDSRVNPFCRSCHVPGHPTKSLRASAPLSGGTPNTQLFDDRRRQPSQAPVRLHGFVPKTLLDMPDSVDAPPEGLVLDPWLYPAFHPVETPE